jgi:hypothetical protein
MRLPALLLGAAIAVTGAALSLWQLSQLGVHRGYAPEQPVAFSHRVHAGENQIRCLYCHHAARTSRHAGIPPPSVCMNCHGMMQTQTAEIEKLEEAVQQQRAIVWVKVHHLPDHVHFDHSRHVLSGVACQRCHGAVERMDRVRQVAPLTMGWCLECHRERARLPDVGIQRAARHLAHGSTPAPGLDCGSCHH